MVINSRECVAGAVVHWNNRTTTMQCTCWQHSVVNLGYVLFSCCRAMNCFCRWVSVMNSRALYHWLVSVNGFIPTLVAYMWQIIQESPADARVTRCSKMAVSRHLGYYRTGNSVIRSTDPENPCLEPDIEWIGCTFCEIFAFKLYCDLETGFGVTQGHRKWHH